MQLDQSVEAAEAAPLKPRSAEPKKKKGLSSARRNDLIFVLLMILWPVLQFVIFYVVVNLNSFALSFEHIDALTGKTTYTFENFRRVFSMFASGEMFRLIGMSVLTWFITLIAGTTLGLLFSYFIYKKLPLSGFFRVVLFMPSIISAIVMVVMFRFFVEQAIPDILNDWFHVRIAGLIENPKTRFGTIMFYNIWVGFGTSVLMYSNKMSTIDPEIMEAARMDGATGIKEFWYVTLPMVYPTLSVFLVTGIAGIFTNQMNLYSFFGNYAPDGLQTFGYYVYTATKKATSEAEYPIIAAMSFIVSCVAIPITLVVRFLLNKYGPSEDR